jgi:hypothetical protein
VWAGRPPLTARRVTSGQAARCSGGEGGRVDARLDGITGHFCSPTSASLVADPNGVRCSSTASSSQPSSKAARLAPMTWQQYSILCQAVMVRPSAPGNPATGQTWVLNRQQRNNTR